MTDAVTEDVMDQLTDLNPGDDVVITTEREGEELEIHAHVTDAHHEPPERDSWGWVDGELDIHLDATTDTVENLEIPTHALNMWAKEKRPGEWKTVSFTVWNPAVDDDGWIISDEYLNLGDITSVELETDA